MVLFKCFIIYLPRVPNGRKTHEVQFLYHCNIASMVGDMDRNTRRRTKHFLIGLVVVAVVLYLKGRRTFI